MWGGAFKKCTDIGCKQCKQCTPTINNGIVLSWIGKGFNTKNMRNINKFIHKFIFMSNFTLSLIISKFDFVNLIKLTTRIKHVKFQLKSYPHAYLTYDKMLLSIFLLNQQRNR